MKNYEKVLKLKVFNMEDISNLMGNMNSAKSIIRNMLQKKYIKRIKHNLYAVCDIEYKSVIPSPYAIASKIKNDAYLSYHSAFDYYGVKNQVFYTIYVSTKKRFENFEFDGYYFKYIESKNDFGIIQNGNIRVTDKERTLIDCINKTELAGGNEELIMCLQLLGGLDGEKILNYLSKYKNKKLYSKVGFFLELFKQQYGIDNTVIEKCKKQREKKKLYFNEETKKMKTKYAKDWNLVVPEIFLSKGETLFW